MKGAEDPTRVLENLLRLDRLIEAGGLPVQEAILHEQGQAIIWESFLGQSAPGEVQIAALEAMASLIRGSRAARVRLREEGILEKMGRYLLEAYGVRVRDLGLGT